jgi:hypothetical protein
MCEAVICFSWNLPSPQCLFARFVRWKDIAVHIRCFVKSIISVKVKVKNKLHHFLVWLCEQAWVEVKGIERAFVLRLPQCPLACTHCYLKRHCGKGKIHSYGDIPVAI